jgi:hypothetical protein
MSEKNEKRIYRTPWNQFPDVIVQTTASKLKSLPEYENAKHFDAELGLGILQSNVVSHTGADAETRILGQPVCIGKFMC